METLKEIIKIIPSEELKQKIKDLSSQQIELRNQRKTVRFEGIRTMEPWKAVLLHKHNRVELRHLHVALGILKGKHQSEIEPNSKTPVSQTYINTRLYIIFNQNKDRRNSP